MTFHGLFVGIDRYESPDIRWLNCACRDAVALHALFTDTLGGNTTLLLDAEATRSVIEEQFKRFATCNVEDVVVITFSGHGSETHELVTYDADPQHLSITSIPLETLTQWFADIPARHLVCILDCCFSGGMGAKVLHVASLPRSLASAESLLEQLSGEGRLILTASKATEEAWENPRSGHGLLTYYLLEALQGAEEIRQSGKISIYRLLEYVTQRVTDAASQPGKPQHPTLRGLIDGALTWPIFTPGKLYQMAFPERTRPHITADIQSLTAYGFPAALLSAWARVIPSLNALQLDAINEFGLLEGEHLIISAPPSSGKTLIGELAAVKGALERKRALFLLPLKSLVNDKHQYFTDTYGAFGLRIIRATGAIADDVPAFMRGQYDICLMTYEKFAALALGSPHVLDQVGTIVVDLAMGVNTPAEAVIIAGLEHPGHQPYSVAEYKNMVGRAGRLGFAARGTSYLLALDPHQEHHLWKYYVTGVPEDLQSRFIASDTDPRSLILRVLVAAHRFAHQGISTDDIVDFLESSFGAFQAIQSAQSWRWDRKLLERALDELLGHNLIESTNEGRYQLTELGWLAGQGGIEVESIIRIVEVLASLEPNMINDPTLIATTQLTVELDAVLFPLNKRSTQKEPQAWTSELRRQNIPATVLNALRRRVTDQHQGTLRAKKTIACLLWITDIPMTDIEQVLTQFGGSLDGAAGPIRATSARTCDVLPTVLRVAEVLHPDLDLAERGERLFTRLEVGVPAGVVDLAMQVGSYLTRADYQRLLQAGLCTIEAIEGSSNEALLACLEGNKEKLTIVRDAVPAYYERKNNRVTALPMLPLYQM